MSRCEGTPLSRHKNYIITPNISLHVWWIFISDFFPFLYALTMHHIVNQFGNIILVWWPTFPFLLLNLKVFSSHFFIPLPDCHILTCFINFIFPHFDLYLVFKYWNSCSRSSVEFEYSSHPIVVSTSWLGFYNRNIAWHCSGLLPIVSHLSCSLFTNKIIYLHIYLLTTTHLP